MLGWAAPYVRVLRSGRTCPFGDGSFADRKPIIHGGIYLPETSSSDTYISRAAAAEFDRWLPVIAVYLRSDLVRPD